MRTKWIRAAGIVAVLGAAAVTSADDDDGDVYDNQVEMTAALFAAKPASFGNVCKGLKGVLTRRDNSAACERGQTVLAMAFTGDVVEWAMIAYPASSEDIQGLRKAARKRFGKPDANKGKELTWRLRSGVIASAGYDDQYSTFALARSVPE